MNKDQLFIISLLVIITANLFLLWNEAKRAGIFTALTTIKDE